LRARQPRLCNRLGLPAAAGHGPRRAASAARRGRQRPRRARERPPHHPPPQRRAASSAPSAACWGGAADPALCHRSGNAPRAQEATEASQAMNERYQTMASDLEAAQQRLVRPASHVSHADVCAWLTMPPQTAWRVCNTNRRARRVRPPTPSARWCRCVCVSSTAAIRTSDALRSRAHPPVVTRTLPRHRTTEKSLRAASQEAKELKAKLDMANARAKSKDNQIAVRHRRAGAVGVSVRSEPPACLVRRCRIGHGRWRRRSATWRTKSCASSWPRPAAALPRASRRPRPAFASSTRLSSRRRRRRAFRRATRSVAPVQPARPRGARANRLW